MLSLPQARYRFDFNGDRSSNCRNLTTVTSYSENAITVGHKDRLEQSNCNKQATMFHVLNLMNSGLVVGDASLSNHFLIHEGNLTVFGGEGRQNRFELWNSLFSGTLVAGEKSQLNVLDVSHIRGNFSIVLHPMREIPVDWLSRKKYITEYGLYKRNPRNPTEEMRVFQPGAHGMNLITLSSGANITGEPQPQALFKVYPRPGSALINVTLKQGTLFFPRTDVLLDSEIAYFPQRGDVSIQINLREGHFTLDVKRYYHPNGTGRFHLMDKGKRVLVPLVVPGLSKGFGASVIRPFFFQETKPINSFDRTLDEQIAFEDRVASSAGRPGSVINNLVGWVKSFVGGLFSSRDSSKSEPTVAYTNSDQAQFNDKKSQKQFKPLQEITQPFELDQTLLLLTMFVCKLAQNKLISTESLGTNMSYEEATVHAATIVNKFEKLLKTAANKSGISVESLNFNPIELQSKVTGNIFDNKLEDILYDAAKSACPELKKTEKFLSSLAVHLKSIALDHQSNVRKMTSSKGKLSTDQREPKTTVEISNKPRTCLNNIMINNSNAKLCR